MHSTKSLAFLEGKSTANPRFIHESNLSYLAHQIGGGNPLQTKNALQDLCKLYRQGFRIHPDSIYGIVTMVTGLIHTASDAKVRRWALNTLAQIGNAKDCMSAIGFALDAYDNDEELVAAAVAALCKFNPNPESVLRKLTFPSQVVCLAALQHVPADRLNLSALPVNVETASPDVIKTALVVVGLNRAPPDMFDPDHSNGAIVRAVGKHHDPTVSQYSVWAITENCNLGVRDLGVDLRLIESCPSNVRGWVYQLLAMDAEAGGKYKDYILLGSKDQTADARAGLAYGLKNTFDNDLVPIVLEWFTTETDKRVRQNLIDHLIIQASRSLAYQEHAIDAYRHELSGSIARERMLATASRSELFPVFRKIDYQSPDLFNGGITMNQTTNNVRFGNNAQAGSIAIGGNAENSGALTYSAQTTELLKSRLAEAKTYIDDLAIPEAQKRATATAIADAKATPNNGTITRALSLLKKIGGIAKEVGSDVDLLNRIIQGVSTLAGFS